MVSKSNISYVNGRYIPHPYAKISIEDRGLQFSDGVYEVISWIKGQWIDMPWHLDRLEYSLNELRIPMPIGRRALEQICDRLIAKNRIKTAAYLYLQINRGEAPRNHAFPEICKPSIMMTVKRFSPPPLEQACKKTFKIHTLKESRWARPDIKSVSLLANILAKQEAYQHQAEECWFIKEEGQVSEGSSSNAWIINDQNQIITHPARKGFILNGITRKRIFALAEKQGLTLIERPFTLIEAKKAKEAFISSSTSLIKPVGMIDDTVITDGNVGQITASIIGDFYEYFGI